MFCLLYSCYKDGGENKKHLRPGNTNVTGTKMLAMLTANSAVPPCLTAIGSPPQSLCFYSSKAPSPTMPSYTLTARLVCRLLLFFLA